MTRYPLDAARAAELYQTHQLQRDPRPQASCEASAHPLRCQRSGPLATQHPPMAQSADQAPLLPAPQHRHRDPRLLLPRLGRLYRRRHLAHRMHPLRRPRARRPRATSQYHATGHQRHCPRK